MCLGVWTGDLGNLWPTRVVSVAKEKVGEVALPVDMEAIRCVRGEEEVVVCFGVACVAVDGTRLRDSGGGFNISSSSATLRGVPGTGFEVLDGRSARGTGGVRQEARSSADRPGPAGFRKYRGERE